MANKIISRTELTTILAAEGFSPIAIDMGNGRTSYSTKFFANAEGRQMIVDCKLAGRGGQYGAGNWTWFARMVA